MEAQSLWPDFVVEQAKSPATILREQAVFLAEKTKNILIGEVRLLNRNNESLTYTFCIVAPALGNYRYSLFNISHELPGYPVEIDWTNAQGEHFMDRSSVAVSEADFRGAIKQVFNDPHTIRIINSLYSESLANT